ncbi:putative reverse transcriptase domain-containing protein [Tanacetum coccineum]
MSHTYSFSTVEESVDEHKICDEYVTDEYLTEKEQQELLLDEEALRETLEEEARAKKDSCSAVYGRSFLAGKYSMEVKTPQLLSVQACLLHEIERGAIMHNDMTYSMLHEMIKKKFNLETNDRLNLSVKLPSFDSLLDITDDEENESCYKNEPDFIKSGSSFAFESYDKNEDEKNDCFDTVSENPQPVYHKWKKFVPFKLDIPETPLYKSKHIISKHDNKDSEVSVGNTFDNKEALDLVVRLKALEYGYHFLSNKSNLDRYEVKCYHFKECVWSIRARRKEYGLQQIRGSPYESFEMLPYYCHNLERSNPGTVTHIKTNKEGVFEMLFIALGASMSVLTECIGDNPNLLCISDRHPAIAFAGRPAAASRGGGTGGRIGRGGGRTRGRSGDQSDGRNKGQGSQVGGQGREVNDGFDEVPNFSTIIAQQLQNLLPTIVAQVGDQGRGQGIGRNQNGDAANDHIQGDVGNVIENNDCRDCTYKEFLACNPKEYDGKGGAVVYTRWIEKMESVQDMSGCGDNQKVKYIASSFVGKALTWLNSHIHTLGQEVVVGMSWDNFKSLTREEFCPSNEMQKLETELWNHAMVGAGHVAYTDRFHELDRLVPHSVTPENRRIKRYVYGLAPQIQGMVATTEPKTIQKTVQIARTLTDEALRNASIKKNPEKTGNGGEPSKDRNVRDDNKRTRTGNAFATTTNPVWRENMGMGSGLWEPREPGNKKGIHVWSRGGSQDPNIVTSTFTLNDHYATTLFDFGADYSLVSTTFIPLLRIEPSDLGFSYEIEIASGHLVEIDKVIKCCKLEIEGHVLDINLIPFGSGSFDVIIGMDWLSDHKARIICHEKVVRIPLLDDKVLRVLGEKPEKRVRQLMSVKAKEKKQEEIVVVRDFPEVFLDDLSGLLPVQEIECQIELAPGAMPVAKSPYHSGGTRIAFRIGIRTAQEGETILVRLKLLRIRRPLELLLNKTFDWGDEQEYAFQTLKDKLCNAPVLALPDGPEDFVAYCDVSGLGLGCVLMQKVADALSRKERVKPKRVRAMNMTLQSSIKDRILAAQKEASNESKGLTLIMDEAHKSKNFVHPGADKMYYDLRDSYWWPGIKKDIVVYVSKCLTCLKVKAEHQRPSSLRQQPEIPKWKWERISMDFVTKLPRTSSGHDTIWVIMDRLTKSAHFLPMREDYKMDRLARLYLNDIVARHDVPISIISDRDSHFTSRFWHSMQEALGTWLDMSTAYYPQTDGQSERTIQTLEDMLRACVLNFGGSWDVHLPLVKFSYNNSYHSSDRLKAARDRQKSHADKRMKPLEFNVGDYVSLKVSPWKVVVRFRKKGKLAPKFVGPFEIIEKVGPVAYQLDLPEELNGVHDMFHVSNLKKCLADPTLGVCMVRFGSVFG